MKHLILTIITLFLLSCNVQKPNGGDKPEEKPKEIVVDLEFVQPKENADFEISDATIEGDVLTITVTYSGGCETHEFNAYFNQMYMKSEPPKAGIFIEHKNNNDLCKQLVTERISFSLKNIRYPDKDSDYTVLVGMNKYKGWLEYTY